MSYIKLLIFLKTNWVQYIRGVPEMGKLWGTYNLNSIRCSNIGA